MVYCLHSLVTFTQNSEHHGKQIFSSWYLVSLLGFIAVSDLGHMVNIGTLLAFSSMWVLVMRKKKCDAKIIQNTIRSVHMFHCREY
jgi:hypothetical protein